MDMEKLFGASTYRQADRELECGKSVILVCSSRFELTMSVIVAKVEWFKFSAKATRWREEVIILEEEIRRIQQFFLHKSVQWHSVSQQGYGSDHMDRGKTSFCMR